MRRAASLVPLSVLVVCLLLGVWLPFVNRSGLWFGMPPLLVWSCADVALLVPALMLHEAAREARRPAPGGSPGTEGTARTDDMGQTTDDGR